MNKTWSDFNIVVPAGPGPELYTTCPQCSASRRKKLAKCLSVNIERHFANFFRRDAEH